MSDRAAPAAIFDAETVWSTFGGDAGTIRELVALLRDDLPRYVTALCQAGASGDPDGVARAAHTIRGAVGNVAAVRVADLAFAIEQAAGDSGWTWSTSAGDSLGAATLELFDALAVWSEQL